MTAIFPPGPAARRSRGTPDYRRPIDLPGPKAGFVVSQLSARTGLRLSGRADLDTVDLLKHAIAALPTDVGEIHLQLASLEFIDEAAARELVMLTARPNRPRLVLHYPPPVMLRLLRLCWPEARPRFTISAGRPDKIPNGPQAAVNPRPLARRVAVLPAASSPPGGASPQVRPTGTGARTPG